jgi:hypothetical protein
VVEELVSVDEFCQKYEVLMGLSAKHPAFVSNFSDYMFFISRNLSALGDRGSVMYDSIEARLSENQQVSVFISMCQELNRLRKSNEILLNNAPLVNYLFARSLSIKFVKEVRESDFFDLEYAALFKNKGKFETALYETFRCFDGFEDKFEFYPVFRRSLILMFGNGILMKQDVERYLPVVEKFESEIEAVERELSLSDDVGLMNAFGDGRLKLNGAVSGKTLLEFFRKGPEFLMKLSKSGVKSDYEVWKGLMDLMLVSEYDPVCDFVVDKQMGTQLMFHHDRRDVFRAMTLCQSMVNLFTPDLLVQTALSDYYDVVLTGARCDVDLLVDRTVKNLALLREQGIINVETQQDFVEKMKAELATL